VLQLTLYSRPGCHLCDVMLEALAPLCAGRAQITVVNIDTDPELRARYAELIPVLSCEGEEICRYRLGRRAVQALLARMPD